MESGMIHTARCNHRSVCNYGTPAGIIPQGRGCSIHTHDISAGTVTLRSVLFSGHRHMIPRPGVRAAADR